MAWEKCMWCDIAGNILWLFGQKPVLSVVSVAGIQSGWNPVSWLQCPSTYMYMYIRLWSSYTPIWHPDVDTHWQSFICSYMMYCIVCYFVTSLGFRGKTAPGLYGYLQEYIGICYAANRLNSYCDKQLNPSKHWFQPLGWAKLVKLYNDKCYHLAMVGICIIE